MKKINAFIEKYYDVIFTAIVIIGTLMYLSLIGGKNVWADEAYTFALIKHNFSELWSITAADVHPPLYYILIKLFTQPFNYNLIVAKIFSIIPYIVIILFGGIQLKKYFSKKTSLLFMGLFLLFPFSLSYVVEVRMYSLAAMFVFLNAIFAYRCYKDNSNFSWSMFALFGICAAYTHYFAMVSVGITYGILLIVSIKKKMFSKWLIAAIGTILFYIPWLAEFVSQLAYKINNEYWIEEITPLTLLKYIYRIFGTSGNEVNLFFIFPSLSYLIAFISVINSKQSNNILLSICMLSIPLGTIFIGVIASLLIRPVFVIRYVVPAIPLLIAFMAIALGNMENKKIVISILSFALIIGIQNYVITLLDEYKITEDSLESFLLKQHADYDTYIVLTKSNHTSQLLAYYNETKIIFDNQEVSAANPFNNIKHVNDFSSDNQNIVLLFLDVGQELPTEYTEIYNFKFLNKIVGANSNNTSSDVYLLTK